MEMKQNGQHAKVEEDNDKTTKSEEKKDEDEGPMVGITEVVGEIIFLNFQKTPLFNHFISLLTY